MYKTSSATVAFNTISMKRLITIISCFVVLNLTAQEVVVEYPYNPDFENDGNVGVEDLMQLLGAFGNSFDVEQIMLDGLTLDEWAELVNAINISQQQVLDSLVSNSVQEVDSIWLELSGDTLRLMPVNSWVVVNSQISNNSSFQVSPLNPDDLLPLDCVNWILDDGSAPSIRRMIGVFDGWLYYMTWDFQLVKITGNSEWMYVTQNIFGEFTEGFASEVFNDYDYNPDSGRLFYMALSDSVIVGFGKYTDQFTSKVFTYDIETGASNMFVTDNSINIISNTCNASCENTTEAQSAFDMPWLRPYQHEFAINVLTESEIPIDVSGNLIDGKIIGSGQILDLNEEITYSIPGEFNNYAVFRNDTIIIARSVIGSNGDNLFEMENVAEIEVMDFPAMNTINSLEISNLSSSHYPVTSDEFHNEYRLRGGEHAIGESLIQSTGWSRFFDSPLQAELEQSCLGWNYIQYKNGTEYAGEFVLSHSLRHVLGIQKAWIHFSYE